MMLSRNMIIGTARSMIGTPFHHQGRKPGIALDCLGFIVCTANLLGCNIRDNKTYRRFPNGSLLPKMREQLVEIPLADIDVADIMVFQQKRLRNPWHVAFRSVYRDTAGMIHACLFNKKVIEQTVDSYQHGYIAYAFRLPGLN